jgi:internalin A
VEIITSSVNRIFDYYFRTRDPSARQPLNEFKLILVGRGGVGKTTLVHRLQHGQYRTFRRTRGVRITKWPMELDGEPVYAHIWDFGGQEIMHGTHRFFMTERALYLILLSGREGTEDQDAEYWLSLVRSFAGDVPIIVLLHKWSDYPFELNRALLRAKYGDISFLETDSATDHGLVSLRQQIAKLASGLPGVKASWPAAWQEIKDDLPRQRRNWLTFEDFCQFCSKRGVVALGDQEALAGYLHDLGMMLSYRRDEALRKFGVLNPQWVTKGIYEMLNASQIRDAGGRFTLRSFGEVLRPKAYPEALHPYLLALMLRFRLCHPLDTRGGKYLIPESLSKEEPALDSEFPPAECLNFEYHYASVLPEGLLPRFIVESYVHREPRHAWRSGVVLERANCRAMVRGDLQARTVTIRVAGVGNGRRELLGIIREHFERIHSSYEKLPVVARVPIPGHPDVRVDHDLLLTYEREGEREIPVPVGTRLQRFNVIKLLDGVDLPGVTRSVRATRSGASGSPVARTLQLGYTLHEDELRQALSAAGFQEVWPGVRVFVTYSQRDAVFLDQLRAALVPHERLGELKLWCDALLEAGQLWEREILGRLERAQIVILLLSNDFLRSSYCMDQELPRALERQARGQCEIVPILVRACRYEKLELGKIQTIRPGDKSIDEHDKKDPAWVVVTHEIDRVMERIKKRQHDEGTSSNALLLAGSTAPT